jgi:hypothetical protein
MFQMKRILLIIALVATAVGSAFAQIKLGDNPGNLNQNALLELESSSKGLLLPRMNTAQQNSMTAPPDGMMIYNTDSACISIRGAGFWHSLCAEGNGKPWGTLGNSNTDPANNYVGTRDNQSLVFRTNNAEVMRILTSGNIGIGTTTPTNKLHIVAATNPLRLEGLQTGAGTDNVVTVDATGVARILSMAAIGANSFTADNGLTKTGSNVQLGGTLISATLISTTATNTLALGNLQQGLLSTDSVLTTTTGGVVQRMSMAAIGANAITVGNGLTKVGNLITLGGALTTPTTVATTATNVLNITGLQTSAITDSVVTIDATTGQLRRTTMAIIGANAFTANNGLTKTGSNVQLGGSLIAATAVNTSAANTLTIGGLQRGLLATDSVMTLTVGGVLQQMSMSDIGANSITVGNGLTKVGNLITFGGGLTTPTTINTSVTNTLTLGGIQTGTVTAADSILITGTGGVIQKVGINALSAASPDFWLDTGGLKPDGTTDNTDNVYHVGNVGIGATTAPTSKFQVTGSVGMSITTTTAALTLDATHYTVIANCTAGAVALTLPAAGTCAGRIYYITKSDETTNLMSFTTPLKLTESTNVSSYNYTKRLTVQSDGTNWRVISE